MRTADELSAELRTKFATEIALAGRIERGEEAMSNANATAFLGVLAARKGHVALAKRIFALGAPVQCPACGKNVDAIDGLRRSRRDERCRDPQSRRRCARWQRQLHSLVRYD